MTSTLSLVVDGRTHANANAIKCEKASAAKIYKLKIEGNDFFEFEKQTECILLAMKGKRNTKQQQTNHDLVFCAGTSRGKQSANDLRLFDNVKLLLSSLEGLSFP